MQLSEWMEMLLWITVILQWYLNLACTYPHKIRFIPGLKFSLYAKLVWMAVAIMFPFVFIPSLGIVPSTPFSTGLTSWTSDINQFVICHTCFYGSFVMAMCSHGARFIEASTQWDYSMHGIKLICKSFCAFCILFFTLFFLF